MTKWDDFARSIEEWDLLENLPREIKGFTLTAGAGACGDIYNIAAYVDAERHSRLDFTFTKETEDYLVVKTVGMHCFRDERYFNRSRENFAAAVLRDIEKIIAGMIFDEQLDSESYSMKQLGLAKWGTWRELPKSIAGFELFITPEKPLQFINGSVIFLNYVDWNRGSELYILYNEFRNEIFGEMVKNGQPFPLSKFDVPANVKDKDKLRVLGEILKDELESTLRDF
ncbi:MAG: hypothetical protein SPI71_02075 [Acidaminococcaceae bacterium]|nr:hypothetical protein [Acidaminococcaceae bacterium]